MARRANRPLAWLQVGAAAWVAACADTNRLALPLPPAVARLTVQANLWNALSAVMTFEVSRADSARAVCRTAGHAPVTTPYSLAGEGEARIVTLGLQPSTEYRCSVTAIGAGGTTTSDSIDFRSGNLPASLQGVRLELTGTPPPGYLVTEVTRDSDAYAVAFDTAGAVCWYRRFATRLGEFAMETKQHPNGDFTTYVGASTGWQPVNGRYFEFRADGELVRTYAAGAPYYTDNHELLLSFGAGAVTDAHLFGYDLRNVDLSAVGGRSDQLVAGHTLLRQSTTGANEFLWSAWDHFSIADWIFVPPNLGSYATIDFDHPNSLVIDAEGNYVASFAGPGEITRIDAVTGDVLWRFGGRHNQFSIIGDSLGGFGFQHDVHVLANGDLLFYDNGLRHSPPESRAVEYRLDTRAMTATLLWEYRHDPPVFTPFVGSVERFQNDHTLIGFGAADLVTEVTLAGQVLWEGRVTVDGQRVPFFYRVRRLPSLYRYQQP